MNRSKENRECQENHVTIQASDIVVDIIAVSSI